MTDEEFKREVIRLSGPEILMCIQCGTCSASCPTAHLMKPSIRRLMKLVLEGKKDEAINNNSIWLCTSCQLCTVRCPRGIRPKAIVGALKDIAEKEGIKGKDPAYDVAFQRQIKESGRISELPLTGEYIFSNPKAAIQAMEIGIEMAPRGKISLEREKVKRPDEVKRIIEELGR